MRLQSDTRKEQNRKDFLNATGSPINRVSAFYYETKCFPVQNSMRECSGSVRVQMKRGSATSPANYLAVRPGSGAVKGTLVYGPDRADAGREVWR